jgi:diguanylate cyclase (GGDEF)-like protein/hemerythrin-like metal-binding protein
MIPLPAAPPPPLPPPDLIHLAVQAFLAGLLVALALLSVLANRALGDRALRSTGYFGLAVAAAWVAFSGLANVLLPDILDPWSHRAALVLGALSLALWARVEADLLVASTAARRLAPFQRMWGITALTIALLALVPWGPSHDLAELVLGLLAPTLAGLTLLAGLRARREGVASAWAVLVVTLALLVCCIALWTRSAGWLGSAASLAITQLALAVLAATLGWAMLDRMTALRRARDAAQLAAAERQAEELEALVAERNAELSTRLGELDEARQEAEDANRGLQQALIELEKAASTDRLTGAWNRRRFEESILPEIALAHRLRRPVALIMFDLDHFKRVNDTYGHGVGDSVLVHTAQIIRLHLRASDALIRWGGEEFLVMAPGTREDGALALAEKLRAAVATYDFPGAGPVTMSLGVSEYAVGEGLPDWIERTDQALYLAKHQGRNRVVAASPSENGQTAVQPEHSLLELTWEDSYACGHPLIDSQHERLFRLAEALLTAVTKEGPITEVSLRLETLLAHTAQHFRDEEALLRELDYPELETHRVVHTALLTKARRIQRDVLMGQLDFGQLIAFLAMDLVKGHILGEDRNYFELFAGN